MNKGRLEAFSDGVIAIIITIMVLELKVPQSESPRALLPLAPVFLSYVLSFVYVAIYWNNHHHMLHTVTRVTGTILWANLHLLFWLSLVPFSSDWMGEQHFAQAPTMIYAFNLLACAIAYALLLRALIGCHGRDSHLARAIGTDQKGKISIMLYLAGIAAAWLITPLVGFALTVVPALIWLVPDRRMERAMQLAARDAEGGPDRS